jgi:hypothetical protein
MNVGWGVQVWGPSPWGGYTVSDQPPLPIGDFDRWQVVQREPRFKHEPEIIRNVLFKVDGVEARARLGQPTCGGGRGIAPRLRRSLRMQCGLGAVAVETGIGTWARAQAASSSICQCGGAEGRASGDAEPEGLYVNTDVGLTKVRAIQNPTDEDLLMMIAEML